VTEDDLGKETGERVEEEEMARTLPYHDYYYHYRYCYSYYYYDYRYYYR